MKKLLLLLAGLLFAVLPSKAQDKIAEITSTVVTNIEDLTTGYYVINCYIPRTKGDVDQNSPEKPWGSLYYNPNRLDRPFDVTSDGFIFEGQSQVSSEQAAYIWFVSKDESGILKIQNVKKEVYIPVDPDRNKNMNMGSAKEAATLKGINKTYTDILERTMSGIVLQYTEESVTKGPWTIHANYASPQDPNLSYWTSGDGEVIFQFVKLQNIDFSFKYPFKTSIAPTAEGFSPNTYWYYMTVKEKYVTHDEKLDYCPASATNPVNYGSFWAFVKNEAGQIEIYNAATGPDYVLASSTPTGDGGSTCPIMKEKSTLADTEKGVWNIKHTGSDNFFFLNFPGVDNAYMNYREPKLAFWVHGSSNADDGSKLRVQEVDINTLINTVREQQSALTGAVGTLVGESYAAFTAALNKGTIDGLIEALKIRDLTGQKVTLNYDKFYRLKNVRRGGYLGLDENNTYLKCATSLNNSNASLLWKIAQNDDNTVKLFHANAQKNVEAVQQSAGVGLSIALSKEGANYNLKEWNATQFGFYINSFYLVQSSGNGAMGSWNEPGVGSDHAWYFMPAEDIELNISDAGYATVNYPFPIQLPKGLTAYTGTANAEKSKFMLEEVSGGAVPANTPVVIQGAAGPHTLTIDYANTAEKISRDLSGSLLPIEITSDDYILANNGGSVGFYKTTDGGTLAQNKAYIESTPAIQAVRGFGFSTEGDGTTGIENTVTETENEEYYDLQGRRVMNPTKGIYVTKSGKKVLFVK